MNSYCQALLTKPRNHLCLFLFGLFFHCRKSTNKILLHLLSATKRKAKKNYISRSSIPYFRLLQFQNHTPNKTTTSGLHRPSARSLPVVYNLYIFVNSLRLSSNQTVSSFSFKARKNSSLFKISFSILAVSRESFCITRRSSLLICV
jgi:hypothetical protein